SGTVTSDEYRQMMAPIYAALERGEKLNIYFELADDFHGLDWGALVQDLMAAGSVGLKHRSSWQRMALVTDKGWVKYGAGALGWLAPGELRLFHPIARDEARAGPAATSSAQILAQAATATDSRVEFLNPDGLPRNPAFSNVAVVSGSVRTIYIGGQDAVDAEGNIVGIGDIAAQTEQVLSNLRTALAAAGAGPEHIVKWNVLIVEGQDFTPGYAAFRRVWGDRPNPPVITAAVGRRLAHSDFLIEIDAIAVAPA